MLSRVFSRIQPKLKSLTLYNRSSRIFCDKPKNIATYPNDLLKHYTSLQVLHYLGSCQKLGILDAIPTTIENNSTSIQDIAKQCNIKNPENLYRTLRFLSLFGYTKQIKNKDQYCYVHTDLSKQYANNNDKVPYDPWAYYSLAHLALPVFTQSHFSINEWLLNDIIPFNHYYKTSVFGGSDSFVEQKDNKLAQEIVAVYFPFLQYFGARSMNDIANHFDFSTYNIVSDIGGGIGQMCAPILCKYNNIKKVVIFDTTNVIQQAKQASIAVFGADNISNNKVDYAVGDFFDVINVDIHTDVYLLRYILHDWDDNKCHEIISNVRKSMGINTKNIDNKRLLIVEKLMKEEDQEYDDNNILDMDCVHLDMLMSLMTSGKERTLSEYDNIMQNAGNFKRLSVVPVGACNLIEYKPL